MGGREEARAEYEKRLQDKRGGGGKDALLTKTWTLRAFLGGYELLSAAFGIEWGSVDMGGLSIGGPGGSDSVLDKDSLLRVVYVPAHLLDGCSEEDMDLEGGREALAARLSAYYKDGDVEAYSLLCRIVWLFESVAWSSLRTGDSDMDLEEDVLVVPVRDASDLLPFSDFDAMDIIAEEVAKVEENTSVTSSEDWREKEEGAVGTTVGTSSGGPLVAVLELLREAGNERLVGATLYPSGYLNTLLVVDGVGTVSHEVVEGGVGYSEVSNAIRARLLSLVATVAYLAGDADGARRCLETSVALDNDLMDSHLKLAAVLADTGNENEVGDGCWWLGHMV